MRRSDSLLTIATLALASSARPARAQALEQVRIVGPISEAQTNIYYAIKTGMFAKAGLDVSLVKVTSGAVATEAVITGAYEIGITNVLAVFAGHLRGIPIAIVAPGIVNTARNPNAQLQIAADAPYKTGADLNGKIAASPGLGDVNSLATRAWVDKNGGDSRTVKFVEIPNVALEAALTQHRIDAAVLQSPVLEASLANGTTKTIGYAYGAIAPIFMGGAYVGRRDWADQHAGTMRRVARVMAEATTYINAHLAETAPLVTELTLIALDNTAKMHRTINGTVLDPALLQPVIDVAAKYGTIPQSFPARDIVWT